MEAYITNLLAKKAKSPVTLKNRARYIFQIYRLLDSDATDLSFLNDKRAVMAIIRNSVNIGTQKTRLFHVSEMVKLDKAVTPSVKAYYAQEADKMKIPVANHEATNIMNEKQKANHISIDSANLRLEAHLKAHFANYGFDTVGILADADFDRLNDGNPRRNIYTFAKGVQECLIPALYIWQTALRNDWSDLQITRKIIIPNKSNWLQISKNGSMTLVLNEYKNAKYFGKQRIPLELKLKQLMTIWLSLLERLLQAKPIHPLYYSINARGKVEWIANTETLAKQLSRISQKIFDRACTINTFRHAHEMKLQESDEYRRMTVIERKQAHAKLLHSLETGVKYNLQRRD
jgi:hypothetical protein